MNKKALIYNATLELISKNGFLGTPMSKIAKEAGVSVGSIYHYFSGKEELINTLYLDIKKKFIDNIAMEINSNLPIVQNLQQLLENVFNYYFKNWKDLSYVEQYENSLLIDHKIHAKTAELLTPVLLLFEKASDERIVKHLRSEILMSLSFGATIFLAKSYISQGMILNYDQIKPELIAVWDMIKSD
jgi:AcrR family transcriptional regulator